MTGSTDYPYTNKECEEVRHARELSLRMTCNVMKIHTMISLSLCNHSTKIRKTFGSTLVCTKDDRQPQTSVINMKLQP